ncbi:unnamed protein product [Schistosoma margrebowiei]|uniref:Uncharacterized protein n=1 Tax=Schistosoma margrebowiei TaxID=48269 RepID=A0AA84Z920_9TREM|nr:unnamed protein product [Schistosoma margrebowiei]
MVHQNPVLQFFLFVCTLYVSSSSSIPWPPKENYFDQTLDHYNFQARNLTFKQRYLYEDKWFKPNGPIFFYCGNEGGIDGFWNNTGLIFELAPSFNAFVLFAEHRYYGKSLPFDKSFQQPYIQYLSVDQALADYAYLIEGIKSKFNISRSLVVAFGGSYGGMLAAYMRAKYPHIIKGALAASAPVRWVAGEGNFHDFFERVTKDYHDADPKCSEKIKNAFNLAVQLSQKPDIGYKQLSNDLRLCKPIQNDFEFYWVLKWARNAFVMMAMLDYPYKASFMASLPANPVNVSCKIALSVTDVIPALREAVGVFYNSSQSLSCFDYKTQFIECADITGCGLGSDSLAWDFQSCTEMNLHDDSDSTTNDMFTSLPLTKQQVTSYCQRRWGVTPAFNQLSTFYGDNIWKTSSNIIFSNGNLDPWMGGGILTDQSEKVISLVLDGGAHHLDLRSPDPNDPPSARQVRQIEVQTIRSWLDL